MAVLDATLAAIGRELSALGGFRLTRLAAQANAGASTFTVESTHDWPSIGFVVVDGTRYRYTGKTITTFTGIAWHDTSAWVSGARYTHLPLSACVDASRTFSALDETRGAILVDTATGADLNALGRNLGVMRPPSLPDDDQFRDVLKAIAYAPKGTERAIRRTLDALLGPGTYRLWENADLRNNTIFLDIDGTQFLVTSSQGRTYLTNQVNKRLVTAGAVTLPEVPDIVSGVRLAREATHIDVRADRPSEVMETPHETSMITEPTWTHAGTLGEVASVTIVAGDGGYTRMEAAVSSSTYYERRARVVPSSEAEVTIHYQLNQAGSGAGVKAFLAIRDGSVEVRAQLAPSIQFVDSGGAALGASRAVGAGDPYHSVTIRKRGSVFSLYVNGAFVSEEPASSFGASATNGFAFGIIHGSTVGPTDPVIIHVKSLATNARTTRDYWNLVAPGETNAPDRLDAQGVNLTTHLGKGVRTYGGANPANNGSWLLDFVISAPDIIRVRGPWRRLAIVETANPTHIRIADDQKAFQYPEDLTRAVYLQANLGPNQGTWSISGIINPATGVPFTSTETGFSNTAVVTGASFVTETEIDWYIVPVFVDEPVTYEVSGMGSAAGAVLTLAEVPPVDVSGGFGYVLAVEVVYSMVKTGYFTAGVEIANSPLDSYYPFYLPPDPLTALNAFLDDLTVAGVIPEVTY